ncbi:MAG: PD40 domain-containing protein [Planctomycetes bacterium]|nr:PD40 domain-containing protein [Planctomycetota bacterium]MBI3843987.1 PD40 domain-containing protein [Planctomycetota bacterium]
MSRHIARFSLSIAFIAGSMLNASAQDTTLESRGSDGRPATATSSWPSISDDGRYLAFQCAAEGLATNDSGVAGRVPDVYWRDRVTGRTLLADVPAPGVTRAGWGAQLPAISGNGRFVVFQSGDGLVASDTNGLPDIYVFDSQTERVEIVSVGSDGSESDGVSQRPSISADGRFVEFLSASRRLAPRLSPTQQAFVRDRQTRQTVCVSTSSSGVLSDITITDASISGGGRFVAFACAAANLTSLGGNGRSQIYVHDLVDGTTTFCSPSASGGLPLGDSSAPRLSADGNVVTFASTAADLGFFDVNRANDVFVFVRSRNALRRVSETEGGGVTLAASDSPSISPEGTFVAFRSFAGNLVAGDLNEREDVFLRSLVTGRITRVNVRADGAEGNEAAHFSSIAAGATCIAFDSDATNFVDDDSNGARDVFVRTPRTITSLLPAVGSEEGADLVHVRSEFDSRVDTTLTFGGQPATIVALTPDALTVRTPPGRGTVDVVLSDTGGSSTTPPVSFTYVVPELAARYGNVNEGLGDRENPLRVNDAVGDPLLREFVAGVGESVSVAMLEPSSTPGARFVAYAWPVVPTASTLTRLPRGLGALVCPAPFVAVQPQPAGVWNNLGYARSLGAPTLPSTRAPSFFVEQFRGARHPIVVTFQGLIEDTASAHTQPFSVTNSVVVRIP